MVLVDRLIHAKRWQKRVACVSFDLVAVFFSMWAAFYLRLGEWVDPFGQTAWLFLIAPVISVLIFIRFGLYRAILRYIGQDALITVLKSVTISTLVITLLIFWLKQPEDLVPRSVVINFWMLSLLFIGGSRYGVRRLLSLSGILQKIAVRPRRSSSLRQKGGIRVAIYGAGPAGFELVGALDRSRDFKAIAFIDSDPQLTRQVIGGLPVYSPDQVEEIIDILGISEIFLALPGLSPIQRKVVVDKLEPLPVHVRSLPSLSQMTSKYYSVSDIREVDVADLLGREQIESKSELLEKNLKGKVVLVTGAGGTIGSEICHQAALQRPKVLILFDVSEYALYKIEQKISTLNDGSLLGIKVLAVLGSVQNCRRLKKIMKSYGVHTVYHAAAYKHVPIVEENLLEGLRNNVLGTLYCAQAALQCNAEQFVLISTDKAVRPTNVMGATKRLSEMLLLSLYGQDRVDNFYGEPPNGKSAKCSTKLSIVRFGNVLGSSGSVIPLFRKQIESGGPVTVTDPRITRYFMTISEAAELVIQAGALSQNGDVFHLDMGEPVKIVELAKKMVNLSGYKVKNGEDCDGDIEIVFTGLRNGEKLYEELLVDRSKSQTTQHPMIYRVMEDSISWEESMHRLNELEMLIFAADYPRIRDYLIRYVDGYSPQCDLVDILWKPE